METYGINLWAAEGSGMEPGFIAALSVQLPQDCRWRVAIDPDMWWTGERVLQAALLNEFRNFEWGMADPKKRGAPPKPIGPKSMTQGKTRKLAAVAMSRDELLEELARPRKGANDG